MTESFDESKAAYRAVAEEIILAVEQKSVDDLVNALHSFFVLCEHEPKEVE